MRGTAAVVLCALVLGCKLEEPFVRSNPFDPGSPYPLTIAGAPDSLHSIGEMMQIWIERDPPLPASDTLIVNWVANIPSAPSPAPAPELKHQFNGRYVVMPVATSSYVPVAIGAVFNSDVVVWRIIHVGQRGDSLRLSCSASTTLACDAPARAIGARVQVWSKAFDARRNAIVNASGLMARSQITVRDPSVMESTTVTNALGNYHFTAVGPGSTWVVIRSDLATDSVRFVVNP